MKIKFTTKRGFEDSLSIECLTFESRLTLLVQLTIIQTKLELDEIENVSIDGIEKSLQEVTIEKWNLFYSIVAESDLK